MFVHFPLQCGFTVAVNRLVSRAAQRELLNGANWTPETRSDLKELVVEEETKGRVAMSMPTIFNGNCNQESRTIEVILQENSPQAIQQSGTSPDIRGPQPSIDDGALEGGAAIIAFTLKKPIEINDVVDVVGQCQQSQPIDEPTPSWSKQNGGQGKDHASDTDQEEQANQKELFKEDPTDGRDNEQDASLPSTTSKEASKSSMANDLTDNGIKTPIVMELISIRHQEDHLDETTPIPTHKGTTTIVQQAVSAIIETVPTNDDHELPINEESLPEQKFNTSEAEITENTSFDDQVMTSIPEKSKQRSTSDAFLSKTPVISFVDILAASNAIESVSTKQATSIANGSLAKCSTENLAPEYNTPLVSSKSLYSTIAEKTDVAQSQAETPTNGPPSAAKAVNANRSEFNANGTLLGESVAEKTTTHFAKSAPNQSPVETQTSSERVSALVSVAAKTDAATPKKTKARKEKTSPTAVPAIIATDKVHTTVKNKAEEDQKLDEPTKQKEVNNKAGDRKHEAAAVAAVANKSRHRKSPSTVTGSGVVFEKEPTKNSQQPTKKNKKAVEEKPTTSKEYQKEGSQKSSRSPSPVDGTSVAPKLATLRHGGSSCSSLILVLLLFVLLLIILGAMVYWSQLAN